MGMNSDATELRDATVTYWADVAALDVPAGYKQTEVGVIPNDWEVKALGDLGEALIGLTYKPFDVREHGTLVLRSSNIRNETLAFDDNVFVDMDIPERIKVRPGDILICVRNGSPELIGKSTLLDERVLGMTFGAFMAVYRSSFGQILSYLFQSTILKRQINEHLGATINQITNKSLKSFVVPIPAIKAEQRAIAEALSDVDELLGALEALIAKKRAIKQAAMQQLLTGKTRLPGFSGMWKKHHLGELVTFLSGGTPSRSNASFWAGDIPWISATSLRTFYVRHSDSNVTKEAVMAGSKMAPVGATLILVRGSALHNEILAGLVTKPVCFNQDVKALVPGSSIYPKFLTFSLLGMECELLNLVSSAGNTAGVLDTKILKALEIWVPEKSEQMSISKILTDMDAEIAALEARRDKTRVIKQGMMQQLLTGKVRLVEPRQAA